MQVEFNTKDVTIALAPAGCGKTHFLRDRVTEAMNTFRPEDVAFVSYTRMGARHGKRVVMKHLDIEEEQLPFFATLHSLTFNALGLKYKNIFSRQHIKKFNSLLGFNLTLNKDVDSNTSDDKLLVYYDMERSGMPQSQDFVDKIDSVRYTRFKKAYEHYKQKNSLFDFMDCLIMFVKRGKPIPVLFACIDEAQDLTSLQWKVCMLAFSKCEKIYIAGDDYQSIYTYSGAKPEYLIDMAKRYKTIKLNITYRLPKKICEMSKGITDLIADKIDKNYESYKTSEGSITHIPNKQMLADVVEKKKDETWLLLFRNNYYTPDIERILHEKLIPYHNNNGFFIHERTLARIKKFYNFRKVGYRSAEAMETFMKTFDIHDINTDLSDTTIIQDDMKYVVQAYVEKFGVEELVRLAAGEPRIRVSTVHRAKGAEARNVAVFLDCTRRVFQNIYSNLDSELRLLYVACTRSEENLYLVQSDTTFGLDNVMNQILNNNGDL